MKNRLMMMAVGALLLAACDDTTGPDDATRFTWDFAESLQGWSAGFADYPVGGEMFYELDSGYRALPEPLDDSRRGLFVAGNNHSDDLLMFAKRRIDGLEPDTRYRVQIEVEIATNAPRGCAGAGGAAGESVYVKVGASDTEPSVQADGEEHWRLTTDIGNQASDGTEGITIGDVANNNADCTAPVYQLKRVSSAPKVLEVETDAQGAAWLVVGIDSGFEATTRLWYTRIEARLIPLAGG